MVRLGLVVVRSLRKSSRQGTSVGPARKMVVEWVGCSVGGELGVNICSLGVCWDILGMFTDGDIGCREGTFI